MLRILKRKDEDKGNAILILGFMLLGACLLVGGIMLDLTKSYQMKTSYVDAAKKATQAGIMEQTTEGYLKPEAVGRTIYTYENISSPAVVPRGSYFSKCKSYGPSDVEIKVTLRNESGGEMLAGTIMRNEVSGDFREITNKVVGSRGEIASGKYNAVILEVQEGTENILLPTAFSITQSGKAAAAGMRCQKLNIAASAEVFIGGEGDIYR